MNRRRETRVGLVDIEKYIHTNTPDLYEFNQIEIAGFCTGPVSEKPERGAISRTSRVRSGIVRTARPDLRHAKEDAV